ncbi:MAG TPA: hypothetical protein VMR62_39075 [Bryobacteraceae bacterium]|jgi:hypothetical protein|nr:hypothetical protein [Bryobacteraceae bacterium]
MRLLRPIAGLRILTVGVTLLLAAVLFLAKGSPLVDFLIGAALGLSIGVQTMVWNTQLEWHDKDPGSGAAQVNFSHPQR